MDCAGRANVLASAAIDTNVGIDNIFVCALGNCFDGAGTRACTTAYTFI